MILLWIVIPLLLLYSLLILYYWRRWVSLPEFVPQDSPHALTVSVIIPARNEEHNIGRLLDALTKQTYPAPLTEIIVVDDHSDDRTAEIVRQYPTVRLLQLKEDGINAYKKKALEKGIELATGELIVTTDADCLPPDTWLATIVAFKTQRQAVFVAAPVVIDGNTSLVQLFQAMDFMVLQGITAAAVSGNQLSMCNGANLAYEKKAFYEVNGFTGVDHIASGDDMLLMHKIWKKYPQGVQYVKSQQALVSTAPVETWKAFFSQRIRWASKARLYDDKRLLPVLLLVYLFNLSFFVLFVAGFWDWRYWIAVLVLWAIKTLIEWPFFQSLAVYFGKQWTVKLFPLFQPLHILYTIISGLFGQFGKYEWKGRRVK